MTIGWRPHIEGLRCLSLPRMLETGSVVPGSATAGTWCWTDGETGEQLASICYRAELDDTAGTLRLQYTVTGRDGERQDKDYSLRVTSVPLHYGGRRWYLHCPVTDRRVFKLYLVRGSFVARTAIRPLPTYRCQRLSATDRAQHRQWEIRRKLGDPGCLLDPLIVKPKRMRWRTWERYVAKDERLAAVSMRAFDLKLSRLKSSLGTIDLG